jgi:RNA polymerase sigma factor (TIGR02999 family)
VSGTRRRDPRRLPRPRQPPDFVARARIEPVEAHEEAGRGEGPGTLATADELLPAIYAELRRVAARAMRGERRGHTLQPTAVVHEVYLRMAGERGRDWGDPEHFRAVASVAIRHFLTDHARRALTERRGGRALQVALEGEATGTVGLSALELLELDEALERLRALDERQARVVELRYFGGLSVDETAQHLGTSARTVDGDWRMARAWLLRELGGGSA